MNGILKASVLTACLAVTAAAGVSLWDRQQAIAKTNDDAARDQQVRSDARARECAEYVRKWDAGNHAPLIAEFGDYAEATVRGCRISIEINRP